MFNLPSGVVEQGHYAHILSRNDLRSQVCPNNKGCQKFCLFVFTNRALDFQASMFWYIMLYGNANDSVTRRVYDKFLNTESVIDFLFYLRKSIPYEITCLFHKKKRMEKNCKRNQMIADFAKGKRILSQFYLEWSTVFYDS